MKLGQSLFQARKKSGYSQEEVAEKLGVSRQTISKWELDESLPDVYQSKRMAELYNLSLDELIQYDKDITEHQQIIDKTSEKDYEKVNWTKVWSKKYPVLATYQDEVDIPRYARQIRLLLEDLKENYNYNELNAVLVLKDILAHEMKK